MTTVTLGKVKLTNRGAWENLKNTPAVFSKGDLVEYEHRAFIYKNDTPKAYCPLWLDDIDYPRYGTIPSLAPSTTTFTINWSFAMPGGTATNMIPMFEGQVVDKSPLYLYSNWLDPRAKIVSIVHNSSTQSTVTVSKSSTNSSTLANQQVVLGTRRIAGAYDIALNTVDWDYLTDDIVFRESWQNSVTYYPGDVVIVGENSYVAVAGTRNVHPLRDYAGAWENWLQGDVSLPHKTFQNGPNMNPQYWGRGRYTDRSHPYIVSPSWNSKYYTGVPWNLPTSHYDDWCQLRNGTHGMASFQGYRGDWTSLVDNNGNPQSSAYSYYYTSRGASGSSVLDSGEMAPIMHRDMYAEYDNPRGDIVWYKNRAKTKIVQFERSWAQRFILDSQGLVHAQGQNNNAQLGMGMETGVSSPYTSLGVDSFGGRRIVKLVTGTYCSRADNTHTIALDEYGEVWIWGNNNYGQGGIKIGTGGNESLNTGARVNNTANITSPYNLNRDLYFGGLRIIDIAAGYESSYVMTEDGRLWAWGRNNYGQLGYPTNSGFESSDRSYEPKMVPINFSSYGGVQKFIVNSSENYDNFWVLDGQGHVWNCGYNGSGLLGRNNETSDTNASTMIRVSSTYSWSIGGGVENLWVGGGGQNNAFFLSSSNQLWGTGHGGHYIFGTTTSNRTSPTLVYGPNGVITDVVQVTQGGRSGGNHYTILDASGVAYGGGWNSYGAAGFGTTDYAGNQHYRQQQVGSNSTATGFQRVMMAREFIKNTKLIWGCGDYDGTSSHIVHAFFMSADGDVCVAGRDYNYNFPWQGHAYAPQPVHNAT